MIIVLWTAIAFVAAALASLAVLLIPNAPVALAAAFAKYPVALAAVMSLAMSSPMLMLVMFYVARKLGKGGMAILEARLRHGIVAAIFGRDGKVRLVPCSTDGKYVKPLWKPYKNMKFLAISDAMYKIVGTGETVLAPYLVDFAAPIPPELAIAARKFKEQGYENIDVLEEADTLYHKKDKLKDLLAKIKAKLDLARKGALDLSPEEMERLEEEERELEELLKKAPSEEPKVKVAGEAVRFEDFYGYFKYNVNPYEIEQYATARENEVLAMTSPRRWYDAARLILMISVPLIIFIIGLIAVLAMLRPVEVKPIIKVAMQAANATKTIIANATAATPTPSPTPIPVPKLPVPSPKAG